jgi:hypothetical protein
MVGRKTLPSIVPSEKPDANTVLFSISDLTRPTVASSALSAKSIRPATER